MSDLTTVLPEDLLILCTPGGGGRIRLPAYFDYAVAGAVLAELVLAGAVRLDSGRAVLIDPGHVFPHPALTEAVSALPPSATTPRGASLSSCIQRLRRKRAAQPYLDTLVACGEFLCIRVRVLGIFRVTRYFYFGISERRDRCAAISVVMHSPSTAHRRNRNLATLAATVGLPDHGSRRLPRHVTRDLIRTDPIATAVASAIQSARGRKS
ncbi:hypothetical protein ABIA32_004518 [Streptacidiphilus sp. MAP12-20]|uniref:GOLPH3/VPS74 family protein n=1 Tax=Streptacidiphilus sp. MAP12-20 TaxID=3156299 RepID=UPI0035178B01